MKRRFIPGLVLAAAFTLTNCSEQLVSPEKENDIIVDETVDTPKDETPDYEGARIPFEIVANIPVTKTTSNGNGTYWVNGDVVSVYTKADSYVCHTDQDNRFSYDGNQKFSGTVKANEIGSVNDWYCIYPFSGANNIVNGAISTSVVIGADAAANYTQTQTCVNSKTHLAGVNYPLYGITKGVSGSTTPEFTMSHLPALVAVKIVNGTGTPITVNQIGLEAATSKIVGNFTLSFNGETPTLASVDASSSKKAVLNMVNGGDAVQANSEGLFYLAVAPVSDKFTIYVNGTPITKDMTIPLESGKLTTLKVTIPELMGTLTSNTKMGDSEYITWPSGMTMSDAIINGAKATVYTVPSGKNVIVTGKLSDFISESPEKSILPISFYAATPIGEESSQKKSKLDIKTMNVKVAGIPDEALPTIDVSVFAKKFGDLPVSLELSSVGSSSTNNYIVLDESPVHKCLSESKADGFMDQALGEGLIGMDIIRKAFYEGDDKSWYSIMILALTYADGQFNGPHFDEATQKWLTKDGREIFDKDNKLQKYALPRTKEEKNEETEETEIKPVYYSKTDDKGNQLTEPSLAHTTTTLAQAFLDEEGQPIQVIDYPYCLEGSLFGTLLISIYTASSPGLRVNTAKNLLGAVITISLGTDGPVAFWGMNVQSKDEYMYN